MRYCKKLEEKEEAKTYIRIETPKCAFSDLVWHWCDTTATTTAAIIIIATIITASTTIPILIRGRR